MITVKRKMNEGAIRELCRNRNLFTCGTNDEYWEMFQHAKEARTDDEFLAIASEIWEHSDVEMLENMDYSIGTLMWDILNRCVFAFIERS